MRRFSFIDNNNHNEKNTTGICPFFPIAYTAVDKWRHEKQQENNCNQIIYNTQT